MHCNHGQAMYDTRLWHHTVQISRLSNEIMEWINTELCKVSAASKPNRLERSSKLVWSSLGGTILEDSLNIHVKHCQTVVVHKLYSISSETLLQRAHIGPCWPIPQVHTSPQEMLCVGTWCGVWAYRPFYLFEDALNMKRNFKGNVCTSKRFWSKPHPNRGAKRLFHHM